MATTTEYAGAQAGGCSRPAGANAWPDPGRRPLQPDAAAAAARIRTDAASASERKKEYVPPSRIRGHVSHRRRSEHAPIAETPRPLAPSATHSESELTRDRPDDSEHCDNGTPSQAAIARA